MKVQVTKSQFIETDDIVFAEADEYNPDRRTTVYLRNFQELVKVAIYTDYDQFVDTINRKTQPYTPPGIRTVIT